MTKREIKLFFVTIEQLLNLLKSVNINASAIHTHTETLKLAKSKIDHNMTLFKNTEYMKTLSPEEQRVLSQNTKNYYDTHQKLEREIDYLQMTKYTSFIANAINMLENGFVKLEYFYKHILGECGDIILPHFNVIVPKHFVHALYKQQIINLSIEFDALVHDSIKVYEIYKKYKDNGYDMTENSYMTNIVLDFAGAYIWLEKEKERINIEEMPKINAIPLPEEILPKVPEQPQKDKK